MSSHKLRCKDTNFITNGQRNRRENCEASQISRLLVKKNSATAALSHRPSNLCTWCNGTPVLLLFSILYFFICRFVVTIAITTLYTAVYGVTTNGTVSTHYVFCSQPAGAREKFRGAREIYCGARRFFRGARVMAGVVVTLHFVVTP